MKYFIDTNIFLRTLVKEDEKAFVTCVRVLELVKTNKIAAVTATIVLSEIAWTLSSYYGFSKKDVTRAIRSILSLRGLHIVDTYQIHEAINLYERFNVKYIDAIIASLPLLQSKEMTIVSYDQDFKKLPVLLISPEQLITLLLK